MWAGIHSATLLQSFAFQQVLVTHDGPQSPFLYSVRRSLCCPQCFCHQCLPLTLHPHKDGSSQHRFLLSPLKQTIKVHVLIRKNILKSSSLLPGLYFSSPKSQEAPSTPNPTSFCLKPSFVNFYGSEHFFPACRCNKAILPGVRGDPLLVRRIPAAFLPHSLSPSQNTWELQLWASFFTCVNWK